MKKELKLPKGFNFFVDECTSHNGSEYLVSICYGYYAPYVRKLCKEEDIEKTKQEVYNQFQEYIKENPIQETGITCEYCNDNGCTNKCNEIEF